MNIVIKGVPKEGEYKLYYRDTTDGKNQVFLEGDGIVFGGEIRDFVPKHRPALKRIGDELSNAIDYIDTAIDDWTHYLRRKYARAKHKKRLLKRIRRK